MNSTAAERSAAPRRRRDVATDVAVVGGGMVGAATALALARIGLSVALLEVREPKPWRAQDDIDLRVVALAPSSARLLRELGVWDTVRGARMQAYRHMHVWDAANGATLDFDAADLGHDALGWIVENRLLQHILWQALDGAGVQRLCPATVRGFAVADDHVRLERDDGGNLDARLLVAADGAASPLRKQAGITTRGHDYAQRAVVAHVTTERPHEATAWQRFLPTGPIALLPLSDGRSSIVWTLPTAEAERVQAMDIAEFLAAVGTASDFRLGRVTATSQRASFPLRMQLATRYQAERLVLIGDAAHVVHPLAGQGVNLGLRDVIELRDTMRSTHDAGRDVGTTRPLQRYARRRRSADTLDARAFDLLNRMFGCSGARLVTLRGLGMHGLGGTSAIRQAISSHAAGY